MSHPWLKVVALPIAILALYFLVPVDADRAPVGVVTGVIASAVALAGAVLIVFSEVRGARRLSGLHLILVLEIVLVVFSFTYYLIESNGPGQFAELTTRLDALYYATATSATVGFGDVHATGQLARGVVTLHMVFNLVFIAAVVNLGKEAMSERRAARQATQVEPPDGDA